MKNLNLPFANSAKLLFILAIGFLNSLQLQAQYSWHYLGNYDGVYSLYDADHFCIKDGAFAKVSQDGGASFTNLGVPAAGLLAVHYISASELMALTSAGGSLELFYSSDGGVSFTSKGNVLDPNILLGLSNRDLFFLNANVGFVFQQVSYDGDLIDVLLKTKDGGQSWNVVGDTTAFDVSVNMHFDHDGNIFAAGKLSGLGFYVSQDTGKTFTQLAGNVPVINSGTHMAFDGNQTYFVNDVPGTGNSCCYISTDGGATFTPWTASASGGSDLAFISPNNVLVFGGSDTTALSVDNGQSFNTVRFGSDKPVGSTYFIHASDNGQAFYLNDGSAQLWVYEASSIGTVENDVLIKVALFPNPAEEYLRIELPIEAPTPFEVRVMNLSGQALLRDEMEFPNSELDISSLPAGSYLLSIALEGQSPAVLHFVKL